MTQTAAQQAAVIHVTVPRSEIQQVMGPAIIEVVKTVRGQGIAITGPVFSRHFRIDPEIFDFEVGVPVASPVTPAGRVVAGELPAAAVARTVYRGPYERLGEAWGELGRWVVEQGHTPTAGLWESYVSGPESSPDPAEWVTQLNRPLVSVAKS